MLGGFERRGKRNVEVLVDAGAGIKGQIGTGQSALEYAVYGNSTEMT